LDLVHARIDVEVVKAPQEPVEVLVQAERFVSVRAQRVVCRVAIDEPAVEDGDTRFALGDERAVHPDLSLAHAAVSYADIACRCKLDAIATTVLFPNHLAKERAAAGLTREELAARSGIDARLYSETE